MEKLNKEVSQLRTSRAKCEGALTTHNETRAKHLQELKTKKYKTIDEEHRVQLITVHTTEIAHKDLEKYYKALDKVCSSWGFINL